MRFNNRGNDGNGNKPALRVLLHDASEFRNDVHGGRGLLVCAEVALANLLALGNEDTAPHMPSKGLACKPKKKRNEPHANKAPPTKRKTRTPRACKRKVPGPQGETGTVQCSATQRCAKSHS
jgi:hypothetical protein